MGIRDDSFLKCEMTENEPLKTTVLKLRCGRWGAFPECVTAEKMSTAMLRSEGHEFILLSPQEGTDEASVTVTITARNNGS